MTSFDESKIARSADGKFAPNQSSEADTGVLGGSSDGTLRELAGERYPIHSDALSDTLGTEATIERSDWDEVTVRTRSHLRGFDAVPEHVRSQHPRMVGQYVRSQFGAELGDEGVNDDGEADLVRSYRVDADTSMSRMRDLVDADPYAILEDDASAHDTVGSGLRETFTAWGVDPDRGVPANTSARPDLSSHTIGGALDDSPVYSNGSRSVRAVYNPTSRPLHADTTYPADSYVVEHADPNRPWERSTERSIIAGHEFRSAYTSQPRAH